MNADDFKKILSMAINREVEAYAYYHSVSERVKDPNLKKLFHELASDETKHRELLQDYLDKDVTSIKFSASRDYKVADTLASPDLTPDLKPIDGIIIAIRKELEAMQMYTQLASAQEDPKQKEIFMQLANMERGHKARLEDIYTDMAFPESW